MRLGVFILVLILASGSYAQDVVMDTWTRLAGMPTDTIGQKAEAPTAKAAEPIPAEVIKKAAAQASADASKVIKQQDQIATKAELDRATQIALQQQNNDFQIKQAEASQNANERTQWIGIIGGLLTLIVGSLIARMNRTVNGIAKSVNGAQDLLKQKITDLENENRALKGK